VFHSALRRSSPKITRYSQISLFFGAECRIISFIPHICEFGDQRLIKVKRQGEGGTLALDDQIIADFTIKGNISEKGLRNCQELMEQKCVENVKRFGEVHPNTCHNFFPVL
jgi:hypothetical protein